MSFRITHVDHHQRRRQLVIEAECCQDAGEEAVQRLGAAAYLAVIALRRGAR